MDSGRQSLLTSPHAGSCKKLTSRRALTKSRCSAAVIVRTASGLVTLTEPRPLPSEAGPEPLEVGLVPLRAARRLRDDRRAGRADDLHERLVVDVALPEAGVPVSPGAEGVPAVVGVH